MRVRVDSHLTLRTGEVPETALHQICRALTYKNPEREFAEKEQLWNWDSVPKTYELWQIHGDGTLRLPRGFVSMLRQGMAHHGIDIEWVDDRSIVPADWSGVKPIKLMPHQEPAAKKLLSHEQGLYRAPPGAGKTVTLLEVARRAGLKALIVVDKSQLARQWVERCEQHLKFTPGLIGDGELDDHPLLTIAMQQTLWARRDELSHIGFWSSYGRVSADEVHHWSAHTYSNIFSRFDSLMRDGVSATPNMGNGYYPIIATCIGNVVHETREDELVKAGILHIPIVHVVRTNFRFPFHPTFFAGNGVSCKLCDRPDKHKHQNNYNKLLKAIETDVDRNVLIGTQIASFRGRTQLVISDRLKHLDEMRAHTIAHGIPKDRTFLMTGAQTAEERMDIAHLADKGDIVIFSTVANEALDIPRLDTIHLTWPGRNTELWRQKIGRGSRMHADKHDAIVVDYVDSKVSVLNGQARERRIEVYAASGMRILDDKQSPQGMLPIHNALS